MTPLEELRLLTKKQNSVLAENVTMFHAELQSVAPVGETGNFKQAWTAEKVKQGVFTISNNMDYADVLARGRRQVMGKWYGSEQWSDGLEPMLQFYKNKINKDLNEVKV